MHVEYHEFYSFKLNRMMEFKSYGHAGKPMIVFPSSGGRFFEYEDFDMIEACAPFIDKGLIRVYTPDSIDNETWFNDAAWAGDRARRHNAYDSYIIEELVPFIREHAAYSGPMIATGCSMGAYHSANFYFRHPDVFDTVIALSGIYDARYFVGESLGDTDVYLNSPVDYLFNMTDHRYLEAYGRGNIIICTGQGDWEEDSVRDTRALEAVLSAKGIPAWIDYWGHDVNHDWPWWRVQMPYFLGKLHEQRKL
ncbi:esterase (plasmid) [Peptoclostridium acidaminophilum DSM 3953]|uniref:Esterase n=1 Tax=Peptoclostridium acidaminophilum DSM 3953 TaxID=1286171 RepID=W8T8U9_PEPAC|nr:alpha/beta hydrolase-fold protein [Peptoclostridium acidaminophilum]AHM58114.1 esterase [Peptoclostridium acidaminophilum DSM 3953]